MEVEPKRVNIPKYLLQNLPNLQIGQRKKCPEATQSNRCKGLQSEILSMQKFLFQRRIVATSNKRDLAIQISQYVQTYQSLSGLFPANLFRA